MKNITPNKNDLKGCAKQSPANICKRCLDFTKYLQSKGYQVKPKKSDMVIGFTFYSHKEIGTELIKVLNLFEQEYDVDVCYNQHNGKQFYHEVEHYRFGVKPQNLGADGIAMLYGLES